MTRGRRQKPPHLRLVDGTHRTTRHGDAGEVQKAVSESVAAFGPLTRPKYLKRHARDAWARYIAPAGWLDAAREPAAILFCELWAEFRTAPTQFPAAKHTQMRGLMADLGLSDERRRSAQQTEEPDEFFD